ncbi:phage head spike fiber domain-containing protein [Falsiroseomonas sp. CW058]|uniref:phage head spike fiber domain-containing protein n=1 Tax=Falsiroseomonas sp. CW058 TaxID=3388664 RepID=UPI003D314B4D
MLPFLARRRARTRPVAELANGVIPVGISATRSQVNTLSTFLDSAGTWQMVGGDQPRWRGGVVVGVNRLRNPRAEGASGATAPTNWVTALPAGLSATYSRVTRSGVGGVLISVTGTVTTAGGMTFVLDSGRAMASPGQVWTASAWIQVDIESAPVTGLRLEVVEENSALSLLASSSAGIDATRASLLRRVHTRTLNNTGVTRVRASVATDSIPAGTAVTFSIFIGWPQLEPAASEGAVSLPPVGVPGSSVAYAASSSGALLVEGQRTNGVRNPRAEGLVPGNPGTQPTHWATAVPGGNLTRIYGAYVNEDGITGVPVRFQFATAGNADQRFDAAGTVAMPVTAGSSYTASFFARLSAGSLAGLAFSCEIQWFDSAGASLAQTSFPFTPTTARLGQARWSFTAVAPASAAFARHVVRWTASAAADAELTVGWPQLELGTFASTPILPMPGTLASSTRSADLINASLSALGIGPDGACAILMRLTPQAAGSNQWYVQIDDGSNVNRFAMLNLGSSIYLRAAANASASNTINPLNFGLPNSVGMSIDGSGRVAVCSNGGPVAGTGGGPTAGLTTLQIGNASGNSAPLFAEIDRASIFQRPFAESDLPARTASI